MIEHTVSLVISDQNGFGWDQMLFFLFYCLWFTSWWNMLFYTVLLGILIDLVFLENNLEISEASERFLF